jgi:hypothetical protein
MATRKPHPKKEPVFIHSHSLTAAVERALRRMSQEATDVIGREVSSSAIVRALVLFADRQSPPWFHDQLLPLVEEEIAGGMLWGKKKSS